MAPSFHPREDIRPMQTGRMSDLSNTKESGKKMKVGAFVWKEAEETLQAIRDGRVDALVVSGRHRKNASIFSETDC